jgi:hypothetical protein
MEPTELIFAPVTSVAGREIKVSLIKDEQHGYVIQLDEGWRRSMWFLESFVRTIVYGCDFLIPDGFDGQADTTIPLDQVKTIVATFLTIPGGAAGRFNIGVTFGRFDPLLPF